MKSFMSILSVFVLIFSFFGSLDLAAHGVHFDSQAELYEHIEAHIARLEMRLAAGPLTDNEIRFEANELKQHAVQYLNLVQESEASSLSVQRMPTLPAEYGHRLLQASAAHDLHQGLRVLKEIYGAQPVQG